MNPCNWYSNKTTAPNVNSNLNADLNKRANRLPPEDAVVHVYGRFYAPSATVPSEFKCKTAYFWPISGGTEQSVSQTEEGLMSPAILTATSPAHDTTYNSVFINTAAHASASIAGLGTPPVVYGGALFVGGLVTGYAVNCRNRGTIHGGATFLRKSVNQRDVYGPSVFIGSTNEPFDTFAARDGARFVGGVNGGRVDNGAVFEGSSFNVLYGVVNGGAVFNGTSANQGTVNGGATFNESTRHISGQVNGGAVFNDDSCSQEFRIFGSVIKYTAHPTEAPTCKTSKPTYASTPNSCGCG